jgi:hypothetical protein
LFGREDGAPFVVGFLERVGHGSGLGGAEEGA